MKNCSHSDCYLCTNCLELLAVAVVVVVVVAAAVVVVVPTPTLQKKRFVSLNFLDSTSWLLLEMLISRLSDFTMEDSGSLHAYFTNKSCSSL